jgi:seryl-tRNA synthetase
MLMSANEKDTWLDALDEKSRKLEQELAEAEARRSALEKQVQASGVNAAEARRLVTGNAGLTGHFKKQEAEADAAGRDRADAARRKLDDLRGKPAASSGRGRPGAVHV